MNAGEIMFVLERLANRRKNSAQTVF